jgi:hypothetical protein
MRSVEPAERRRRRRWTASSTLRPPLLLLSCAILLSTLSRNCSRRLLSPRLRSRSRSLRHSTTLPLPRLLVRQDARPPPFPRPRTSGPSKLRHSHPKPRHPSSGSSTRRTQVQHSPGQSRRERFSASLSLMAHLRPSRRTSRPSWMSSSSRRLNDREPSGRGAPASMP